jgi:hypothetical protein
MVRVRWTAPPESRGHGLSLGRTTSEPAGDIRSTLSDARADRHRGGPRRREGIQEWTALAALDAVELGEQLGMLHDTEAERRRAVIQARLDDLGRSP